MDMRVVSARVVVMERPDLRKPEGPQEGSQKDEHTSSELPQPFLPECHVVLTYFSRRVVTASILRGSLSLWMLSR